MLGTEPESSGRTASSLNHEVISRPYLLTLDTSIGLGHNAVCRLSIYLSVLGGELAEMLAKGIGLVWAVEEAGGERMGWWQVQHFTVWWLLDRRCLSQGPACCSAGSVSIFCPDRHRFCYCDAEWKGLLCSLGMGLSACLACTKPCVQQPALHKRSAAVCTCDPGTRYSRGGDCFSLIPLFV